MKPGRNDPCPCGSGKKYKQCCLAAGSAPATEPSPARAMQKAARWLTERFRSQVRETRELDFLHGVAGRDVEEVEDAINDLDVESRFLVDFLWLDYLLGESDFERHDDERPALDWVLDRSGPRLDAEERAFLEAVRASRLRIYEVMAVRPGKGLDLRDLVEPARGAIAVHEVAASRQLQVGDTFGTRLVEHRGRMEIATGVFMLPDAASVLAKIRRQLDVVTARPNDEAPDDRVLDDVLADLDDELDSIIVAEVIRASFLESMLFPDIPQLVQSASGEPMLLIEDDYVVRDIAALAERLAAQVDVTGDAASGWSRLADPGAEMSSILTAINPGETPDRVTLFHQTAARADAGREWFARIAGDLVTHAARRTTDPREMFTPSRGRDAARRKPVAAPDIPAADLAGIIERTLRKHYATWSDDPIPVLDNRTPRETIATAAGREQVRHLLRQYEAGERRQAADQGRPPISYEFLWEQLGLSREE